MERADQVYVSPTSIWEIAIKLRLAKIEADPSERVAAIESNGFIELPVRALHSARVGQLPLHHTDPLDSVLVAQSIAESLKLVTIDSVLVRYGEMIVFA